MDINKILSKFFGNKSDRDMREVMPQVNQTKEIYAQLHDITNDELREKSRALKSRIKEYVKEEEERLQAMKEKAEDPEVEVTEKEEIYKEIDKLEEYIDERFDN